jgi:hypothetical protein
MTKLCLVIFAVLLLSLCDVRPSFAGKKDKDRPCIVNLKKEKGSVWKETGDKYTTWEDFTGKDKDKTFLKVAQAFAPNYTNVTINKDLYIITGHRAVSAIKPRPENHEIAVVFKDQPNGVLRIEVSWKFPGQVWYKKSELEKDLCEILAVAEQE